MEAQQNCETAVQVSPGITNVNFAIGSEVPMPVCITPPGSVNATRGAWFEYTPAELHTTVVTTDIAGNPLFDTRVHIYSGNCDALVCVAGDDDSGNGNTSTVSFTAEAGVTYYIAFDNRWNSSNFSFNLTEGPFVPPPPPLFTVQNLTLAGMCITDMNGDYLDDVVSPGSMGEIGILYQTAAEPGFTMATLTAPVTPNFPSWSVAAGDFDKNGYNDLLYGGGSGATIILANDNGTAFDEKIESTQYVFSQRTNFVDINNDGHLDAFVCHDVEPNVYFLNNGTGGATFHQGGLGDHEFGGNYGSIWVDYDNDGDSDLFIAKCRGGGENPAAIDELHRNDGAGEFTPVSNQFTDTANMADMQQSWSSAWADFDNDGDMDAFVGASSPVSGGHRLKRNNGNGTFTDVVAGSGLDVNPQYNIENIAHDFDNDGWVDIFGGGSIIMFNNGDMTFSPVEIPALHGPVGDLNNDGFLDILNNNTLYVNNGNDNNWIKIHLQGIASNRNGIGARVEVYTTETGIEKQIRDVRSGDGFEFMSSLNAHFGLGEAEAIEKVVVRWPSGTVDTLFGPAINNALLVVEGEHVLGNIGFENSLFKLYPNPVKENLQINGGDNLNIVKASIYDLSGKLIKAVEVTNATIPVQFLSHGTYIISLIDSTGKQHLSKFIKN
jgi:hypothetical protein